MSNVAIRVENLGKLYRIGGKQEKYATLRDTIVDIAAAPYRRVRGLLRGEAAGGLTEEIWALKDINFEVKHGEVVGIIGRNGAGKSTLLKILSRITEPTTGYADVYGRVGALLEVGTGFHPELTGRENIFLNGAILGMSRDEINHKFDEIVDFAGVEKFIDTPVKHYSSGMGLRLGFAVAAHLEPEILIVDEVLAVGDAEFQKKCMGKMNDVAGEGRTVLFVSHNMAAIEALCNRSLYLSEGRINVDSETHRAILEYAVSYNANLSRPLSQRTDRTGNGKLRFSGISSEYLSSNQSMLRATTGAPMSIFIDYYVPSEESIRNVDIAIVIRDTTQRPIITFTTEWISSFAHLPGRGTIQCEIDRLALLPGEYVILLSGMVDREIADRFEQASSLHVEGGDFHNSGRFAYSSAKHGVVLLEHQWGLIQSTESRNE